MELALQRHSATDSDSSMEKETGLQTVKDLGSQMAMESDFRTAKDLDSQMAMDLPTAKGSGSLTATARPTD